jgi:3-oxoacyl-[acyl-carrier protein] reductase
MLESQIDLKNKTVVFTDAAQGLGQKMAEIVAGQGANVALVDLHDVILQDTMCLCSKEL